MSSPEPDEEVSTRTVLLDDESKSGATALWDVFQKDIDVLETAMGVSHGYFNTLVRSVSCPTCGANCQQPCITATGKRAHQHHRGRHITVLAVGLAIEKETTITEEDDIEDLI